MSAEATTSAQLPAPRTFAPSRDDVLSNLSFFFGDPAVPVRSKSPKPQPPNPNWLGRSPSLRSKSPKPRVPFSQEKLRDYSEHHATSYHFPGEKKTHTRTHHTKLHTRARALSGDYFYQICIFVVFFRCILWPEHVRTATALNKH